MPDENTSYLKLPLPHPDNLLEGDVFRLRDALNGVDSYAAATDRQAATTAGRLSAAEQATANLKSTTEQQLTALQGRAQTLESGKVDNTDPRLTNARPPTAHAASHKAGGVDALKASEIGGVTPDQLPRIDGLSLVFDGGVWKVNESWLAQKAPQPAPVYAICEFKNWFEQNPPPGWLVRNGAVLANANAAYPKLWEYLHNAANTWKCKTLAQWNSLSSAAGGVGGVPFFVVDDAARTIKLPDTRGDYERAAGSSYLQAVGGWHGDAIRDIYGSLGNIAGSPEQFHSGAFSQSYTMNSCDGTWGHLRNITFYASRIVPVASDNRTRAFAVLGCVYVGNPT